MGRLVAGAAAWIAFRAAGAVEGLAVAAVGVAFSIAFGGGFVPTLFPGGGLGSGCTTLAGLSGAYCGVWGT